MKKIASILGLVAITSSVNAGSIFLTDSSFTFFVDGAQISVGSYEVRWGTVSSGVFTPFLGNQVSADNGGYLDMTSPELLAALSQGDNTVVAVDARLALSISYLPDDSSYALATATNQIVLTDSNWIAPTFSLLGPELTFTFSNNTVVAPLNGGGFGTNFQFNGGNEIINLVTTAIPEPSAFAALAGLAVLGCVVTRRRHRSA